MKHSRIANIIIVLIFALLHFGVAVLSRALSYQDDIMLTVLTITMVIIVSMRNHTRLDAMAVLTLVATLSGYIIGSWLWLPIETLIHNDIIAPGVATFLITSVLGVTINEFTMRIKRLRAPINAWTTSGRNIAVVGLSILVLRLAYFALFNPTLTTEGRLIVDVMEILGNTWAVLTLFVGNILFTMRIQLPFSEQRDIRRTLLDVLLSVIVLPGAAALLAFYNMPEYTDVSFNLLDFLRMLSAALLINLIIATICIFVRLSTITKQELRLEREEKNRSEYRYERLKQQINPHFLFNSLGILDYLVQEQQTERASAFIHKLASIYRYMLNNDRKPLIKLSEEMEFTQRYIDLIKERFIEGLHIEIEIDEQYLNKLIVPCSVQLLVENATKHNIVSNELPLSIEIGIIDDKLVVKNRLQPRTHGQPSTRLGLENIRQQYLDITGHNISIEKTDTEFIVKLPIV
jgi:hypothetical protein